MEKIDNKIKKEGRLQGFFEHLPNVLLIVLFSLLPLFFIPSYLVLFPYSKIILIAIITLLVFFLWSVKSLKERNLKLPSSPLSIVFFIVVPIVLLISSAFSINFGASFIGQGYELGTFTFITLMFLLMFLTSYYLRTKDKIFYSYLWFGIAFLVVGLFHIARLLFGPGFLSFGIFTDITSNTIGKWNDIAVYSGAVALLSLMTLELVSLSRLFQIIFYFVLGVSLVLLGITNFSLANIHSFPITIATIIGLMALIVFVYLISSETKEKKSRKIPYISLIVLIFGIIFTLESGAIGNAVSSKYGINQLDVRPNWQATLQVTKDTYSSPKNALFGVGPNLFANEWEKFKPDGINQTDFWSTDFSYAVGFIPTFMVTSGIIGILGWLAFFGIFLYLGFKAIFIRVKDDFSVYLISSSFFISLYFWLLHVFYIPSIVTLAFAFMFTGIFMASLFREGIIPEKEFVFEKSSRKGFFGALGMIVILFIIVISVYMLSNRVFASMYAQVSASDYSNSGNIDAAESTIIKAINLHDDPSYYRFLAQIELAKLNQLIGNKNTNPDTAKSQAQAIYGNAQAAANAAISADKNDYENWLALGGVYESVVTLGVPGSYDAAQKAYTQALTLDPKNPSIDLLLARLQAENKNDAEAKVYISNALKLKNNYTDAISLLAELQVSENDITDAISSMEAATVVAPDNADVFYQLGVLRYDNKDYTGAINALERSVTLSPTYSNAKYYLGLSYYAVGRTADALAQFEDIKTLNPGNTDITTIISNVQSGKSPVLNAPETFTNATSTPTTTSKTATSTKAASVHK